MGLKAGKMCGRYREKISLNVTMRTNGYDEA